MTITTPAELRAALVAGVETPGAADHAAIMGAMLRMSGRDEGAIADATGIAIVDIARQAGGYAPAPTTALRPAIYSGLLELVAAKTKPAPDDEVEDVTLRVQVNDRASLFEQAKAAYLRSGGGQEAGVLSLLGTAEQPHLTACITEILADADKDGAMEYPA